MYDAGGDDDDIIGIIVIVRYTVIRSSEIVIDPKPRQAAKQEHID